MISSINLIFLKENEKDIFRSLQNQGINTTKLKHHFINLFNKMYNNEVGYYTFAQDEQIYKIIILPKTIDEKSPTSQKEFVDYLLHYHRVNNKYNFDKTKQIPNSLLSLAFEANNNNKEDNNAHNPIEEFEYYKYKSIINKIEIFFKQHKNYKKVQIDYKSQDIKYRLNLSKNIKELDNTKIHQIQVLDMMYSQIATISYGALKLFSKTRIEIIKDIIYQEDLLQNTKKVMSFISKKYNLDKDYKFTLSKLSTFEVSKIFNKKSDTKLLLVDIKSLFGFEQMYQDNEVFVSNRYDLTTTSFFINPSVFYEWYVYDILENFAETNNYQILFDKHSTNKTATFYKIKPQNKNPIKKSSNPDYVMIDKNNKIKIVLDAKWKNISKFNEIGSDDFLKLKLDVELLNDNGYSTLAYLIYPDYPHENDDIEIIKVNNKYFSFGVLKIDMNFDKEKNSINFKYDFGRTEDPFSKEKNEVIIQSNSEQLTDNIDILRSELITQLLNSENLSIKEEIFSELDNLLFESATKLSEEIEEKISPEIQAIIEQYREILEKDSIKFLKSSSSIYNYYKDKSCEHFDYSMPGSGLWKLVELELNTSFIWYIRIKNGVCDKIKCFTPILSRDIERNILRVKLNEYHKNNIELKSLMLGDIKFLSKNNLVKAYFNNSFIANDLEIFLEKIINIRNEHAHIKAMKLGTFEDLHRLLFNEQGNLKRLLDMKKEIKMKMECEI